MGTMRISASYTYAALLESHIPRVSFQSPTTSATPIQGPGLLVQKGIIGPSKSAAHPSFKSPDYPSARQARTEWHSSARNDSDLRRTWFRNPYPFWSRSKTDRHDINVTAVYGPRPSWLARSCSALVCMDICQCAKIYYALELQN